MLAAAKTKAAGIAMSLDCASLITDCIFLE